MSLVITYNKQKALEVIFNVIRWRMGMVVILSFTGKKEEIQDLQKLGNVVTVVPGLVKLQESHKIG